MLPNLKIFLVIIPKITYLPPYIRNINWLARTQKKGFNATQNITAGKHCSFFQEGRPKHKQRTNLQSRVYRHCATQHTVQVAWPADKVGVAVLGVREQWHHHPQQQQLSHGVLPLGFTALVGPQMKSPNCQTEECPWWFWLKRKPKTPER